jgi:hypothetical protein
MGHFKFNNGSPVELLIEEKFQKTKIYISLNVTPDTNSIKLGGFSDIDLFSYVSKNLIFMDHPLGFGFELDQKILTVFADASKFRIRESNIKTSDIPITCSLTVEAGDEFLKNYNLDDKLNCTISSSFEFKIKFIL